MSAGISASVVGMPKRVANRPVANRAMMKAIGFNRGAVCAACWDGDYPTEINNGN